MHFTGRSPDHGTGIAVRELRAEARSLSAEDFADRHGGAFLLLTAADLARPHGPESTEVRFADEAPWPGESTASLALVAYPLRRSERSPGHLITIGRADSNDVIVPDASISRFHAFLREGDAWCLLDAGSTNGTTVNGASVPQQGVGEAVALKSGDDVRLGQVELTFLTAEALVDFVAKMRR